MPRRGSRTEFEASQVFCQCGEVLPPAHAWTDMTRVQHDWRHRMWAHTADTVWANRKPDLADARAMISSATAYIGALEGENLVFRRTINDLKDRVDELEQQLDHEVRRETG